MKNILRAFALILVSFSFTNFAVAEESPMAVDGATSIDAAEAKALFDDGVLFVDTRKQVDWDAGRVPDALHLDVKSAYTKDALLAEAAAGDPMVIYCNGASCMRSSKGAALAVSWGFESVYYFRDGFPAWQAAGYPVE